MAYLLETPLHYGHAARVPQKHLRLDEPDSHRGCRPPRDSANISANELPTPKRYSQLLQSTTRTEVPHKKPLRVTIIHYAPQYACIFGFDSGTGLPKPKDYRDLPQMWSEGHFAMDREGLLARLRKANPILCPVEETIPGFFASCSAPVDFIAFDLDLYSCTMAAFKLLDADPGLLLPRVHCYSEDIIGFSYGHLYGEILAREFNETRDDRQISRIHGLRHFVLCDDMWVDQMYLAHIPDHEDYGAHDGMLQHHDLGI